MKFLKFQKAGRKAVIAIKLNVVESRSDAEPAWNGGRLCAANARHRNQDDISQAQGFTDEDDFKLTRAIETRTTFPKPRGLLTRTTSSSTGVPMARAFGERK